MSAQLRLLVSLGSVSAQAAISWGPPPEGSSGGKIVFDKLNVVNPQYTYSDVPELGNLTVSFGTHFVGQKLGASYNSLSDTSPIGPLALAMVAELPDVMTQIDLANRSSFVLGGINAGINGAQTKFTTPISILFSDPVSHVGFSLGYLDERPPSTVIAAYDASGASLGVLGGLATGNNVLSIVDDGGQISGLTIYIPDSGISGFGADKEGFGIRDVVFSAGGVIPEPGTFLVWSLLGLTAISAAYCSVRSRD